jgi:sporulation protein YlmC with PRC-barrel domain
MLAIRTLFKIERTKKMKIAKFWLTSVIVTATMSPLMAQNQNPVQPANTAAQNLHKLDSTTSGPGIRVSKLMGMSIQNSGKENVGQIKDIVVDPATMRIQYVAVTYGGFLGMGDKMFAVPMQAIRIKQDADNSDRVVLVLDVTKEQMNGAQGFDEAHWPNFSDANFANEIHRRYKTTELRNRSNQDGNLEIQVDRNKVRVNADGGK